MTTSAKQTSLFGTDESTSSRVDFHVNHTQWQGSDKAQRMLDISGQKCAEQFESAGRPGLWARTFLGLLIGQEGWFSSRCALTWKVKGTKYNRLYCQLQVSTLRTGEIGFGLLPTCRANESTESMETIMDRRERTGNGMMNLTALAQSGLLKTPTKMDGEVTSGKKNPVSGDSGTLAQEIMSGYEPTMQKLGLMATPEANNFKCGHRSETARIQRKKEQGWTIGLNDQATLGMLPTPLASDSPEKNTGKRNEDGLQKRAFQQTGQAGQLSPHFVLEMMGFPPYWTELPFLNGETNQ